MPDRGPERTSRSSLVAEMKGQKNVDAQVPICLNVKCRTMIPSPRENPKEKTIVLGIGNILLSDEGLGVHAVMELEKHDLPEGVEVVDGGTSGFGLLDTLSDAKRVIIVDAIRAGGEPGTLYHLKLKDGESIGELLPSSLHGIGILDVIRALELLGSRPDFEIFGIEPKSLDVGMELSNVVRESLPKLINAILNEIKTLE